MNPGFADTRGSSTARVRRTWVVLVSLAAVCVVHIAVLWHFHDRFWYPTDDGFYGHIADRLIAGEVLNRDVQDIHPAYLHWIHIAAIRLFGRDLVVLRYPLIVAGAVMTAAAFLLLARRSVAAAVAGAAATIGLGIAQFLSPNGNWYALSLFSMLAWWMVARRRNAPERLFVAGVTLGLITCLRHLSGAWAAMGVLSLVLLESPPGTGHDDRRLGRALAIVMLAGMVGYLVLTRTFRPGGLLLIVAWPIAILAWLARHGEAADAAVRRALVHVGTGGLLAVAPLIGYHLFTGSLLTMAADTILSAGGETHLQFFGGVGWYTLLPAAGFVQASSAAGVADVANGLYWVALPLAWALSGWIALDGVRQRHPPTDIAPAVMTAFFAMVSVYLEGPQFLYYSISLTLVALLWTASGHPPSRRWAPAAVMVLALVGAWFHAGQPSIRTSAQVFKGTRLDLPATASMAPLGASFMLAQAEADQYRRAVARIHAHVRSDGALLALPNDAELYYLSNRRNASRFYNSALGLRTGDDLASLSEVVRTRPPDMVIFRPGDKYETPHVLELMSQVRGAYDLAYQESGWDFYVRRR